jgi:hypothetical protein
MKYIRSVLAQKIKDVPYRYLLVIFFAQICNGGFHVDQVDTDNPVLLKDLCHPDVTNIGPHVSCSLPPEVIVFNLTSPEAPIPLQIQNILQFDMYHVTYPLNFRNPLTFPSTSPLFQEQPSCRFAATVKPFLNLTNKANFTPHSTKILSYLSLLTDHDFLEALEIDAFSTLKIPNILEQLSQMTEQQREFGVMFFFQGNDHPRHVVWSVAMPLYYFQHNFFLNEDARNRLSDQTFFTGMGTAVASRNFDTFIQDHLINDIVSLGDLRFDIWYNSPHQSSLQVAAGGQITIPTARALLTGLSGACKGTFSRLQPIPFFDLQLLVNLYQCGVLEGDFTSKAQLTELIANYSITALDRLGSILLNNRAGDQHTNFGPTLHLSYDCLPCVAFDLIAEAAYYVPHSEIRLFKTVKSVVNFQRDYNNTADAVENLNFLSQQATDTLYPTAVNIVVKPGMMFHFAPCLIMSSGVFTGTFGYDFWCRSRETFGSIHQRYNPPNSNYIPGAPLDLEHGTKPSAYQGKLFGALLGDINSDCSKSRIGIRGDITIHRRAIGRDFTISLDFIMDF